MVTVRELLQREDFFDSAVLRHGFVDYMRDYEVLIGGRDGPPHLDVHRYLFVGCTQAAYRTTIAPEHFAEALSDAFVYAGPDYPDQNEPDGFIWGVRWSCAYPGLTYVEDGERARNWSRQLGRPMHEVLIETNAFSLRLVFADVRHEFLGVENEPGDLMPPNQFPITPSGADQTSDGGVPGLRN